VRWTSPERSGPRRGVSRPAPRVPTPRHPPGAARVRAVARATSAGRRRVPARALARAARAARPRGAI